MLRIAMIAMMFGLMAVRAHAQDVPGIEICTAEKSMERRTGCLQSNINFLSQKLSKLSLDSQQKLDASNRQIEVLKAALIDLQKRVEHLQAAQDAAAKAKSGETPKAKDPHK